MTLRVALRTALAALALALLPSGAVAQSPSDRFCLMPLTFPQGDGYLIQHYLVGAHPEHDLLVPFQRSDHPILQRRGGTLVPISDGGEALYAYGDVASTPDGGIYGIGGDLRLLALLRFDQVARHFRPVPAAQPPGYVSARTMGWSTPLNAMLVSDGGRPRDPLYNPVWTLTDDTLTRLQGFEREDWITYIFDFPDLNLTALITSDNVIYIIDADQTLHRLGDLAEARTRSIQQARFLPDPPRLMFESRNLNHLFQLPLAQVDGIWQPADRQVSGDLLASIENDTLRGFPRHAAFVSASQTYLVQGYRFDTAFHRWRARRSEAVRQNALGLFRLQGGTLVEIPIPNPDPDLLATLPYTVARGLGPVPNAQHAIDLGFGLTLDLSSEAPMVRDPSGTLHPLAGADALQTARGVHGTLSPIPARDVLPIAERAATLVQVNRAAFLLFDRNVAGDTVCDTSP